MINQSSVTTIASEDWTFNTADTKYMTHGLHPYPARMIPQVASKLIVRYSKPEDTLLDPFMGSGGVLIEATLNKASEISNNIGARKSYGIDINPLAILLAKTKTTPINPEKLEQISNDLLMKIEEELQIFKKGKRVVEAPEFFNIDYWFKPKIKNELQIILESIKEVKDKDLNMLLKTVFSRTVRKCSNTRQNEFKLYRIAEENLREHNPDVFYNFKNNLGYAAKCMKEYYQNCEKAEWARPKILDEDTRKKTSIPEESVDIVVTSPPYGDSRTTVAYGQFSRLSMQWLKIDGNRARNVDNISIGGYRVETLQNELESRTLESVIDRISVKDSNRAKDVLSFFNDLDKCLSEISRVMTKNGKVCIVIGNRKVKGLRIPTHQIIIELGKVKQLAHHITYERRIPTKRMPWRNAPSNIRGMTEKTIHNEYIVVLNKL